MANTIAYTSTNSPTGSLKSGVISINLNTQITGQNYNWRNGIVFSNQYIIYSDTYTQGIDTEANAKPCAWACDYNDTALLNLINSLPDRIGQTQYGSLADAMAWLIGENKYFIVNQNYPSIATDGLVFLADAGMTQSYPMVGTNWNNIANGINNGTLTNGPTYVGSGATSYFSFDGSDDLAQAANVGITDYSEPFSMGCVFKVPVGATWDNGFRSNIYGIGGSYAGMYGLYKFGGNNLGMQLRDADSTNYVEASGFQTGVWYHMVGTWDGTNVAKLYVNGVLKDTNSTGGITGPPDTPNLYIAGSRAYGGAGGSFYQGYISKCDYYNRVITEDEVKQNYYLGPIVTSGLVAAYDSGNLISYDNQSTTWYDMSGTDNGTLTNGISYTINQGGIFNFDGVDDYVQTSSTLGNLGSGDWTFSVWWKANGDQSGYNSLISQGFTGSIPSGAWALKVKNSPVQNFVSFSYASGFETIVDVVTSTNANDGKWHNIVVKRSVNTCTLYMDAEVIGTFNVSGGFVFGTGAVTYIGYTPRDAAYILGNLGIIQKYSRALSDTEISQNYGAYRNRFESNQAFATGGVVTSVIENGVKYRVHTFTSSGTLTVLSAGKVEALVVAGGAGGGRGRGGGGGAGGYIYDTDYSVGTGSKTVTVGAGGAGGSVNSSTAPNGSNSVFDNLTSIGGGGGAGTLAVVNSALNGASGGSGGGGSGNSSTPGPGGVGGNGTASQGFKGGTSFSDNSSYTAGGGGGGAGGEGNSSVLNNSGNGGIGRQNSISGTASFYGAGGGGGGDGSAIAGSGGSSIGGNGSSSTVGGNATVNTGSGGGGGAASQNGGSGGSGIVIIRYRI